MTNWEHMAALVGWIPDLPGARCRGRHELFDATIRGRRDASATLPSRAELAEARSEALRICAACPALTACRSWVDDMRPSRRPRGVVAGRIVEPT